MVVGAASLSWAFRGYWMVDPDPGAKEVRREGLAERMVDGVDGPPGGG